MRLLSLAFAGGCLLAATPTSAAASSKALLQSDASLDPQLETEMSKLNDYLQANKDNEVHVESLYADLQRRFSALKDEWSRADMERAAMRKGLRSAQQSVQRLSLQNERLHALLAEVQKEHQRMASAKEQLVNELGMGESANLSAALAEASSS